MNVVAGSARLQWGDVPLMPAGAPGGLPYRVEASADGTHWGNPEAVVTAVQSRLQDGSLAIVDSFQNREAPIHLRVTSDTYDGLAAGEEALVAETRRPGYNTLTWTPNELLAEPTVFDVVYAVLSFDFDDYSETILKRRFVATLNCLPFPRLATEVVATAPLPPPSTPVVITVDNGSSTTGWTGSPNAVSVVSGAVTESHTLTGDGTGPGQLHASAVVSATRTGSIDTSATPYIYADVKATKTDEPSGHTTGFIDATLSPLEFLLDGVVTTPLAVQAQTGGYVRYYFKAAGASVSTLMVRATLGLTYRRVTGANPSAAASIAVDQVVRTDAGASAGTRRQLTRTLPVAGSVRTQGRLAIEHETSSLGEVLAYVYRDDGSGYIPALRPYYFAGGTVTPDTALVSGGSNMLDTAVEYRIPASAMSQGNHRLYARLKGNSAGAVTLTITAYTRIGSTDLAGTITQSVTLTLTTSWAIYDLVSLALPPTLLAALGAATVRLTIVDADTSGIDVDLDEAWLFNLDIGALTHVDCGSTTPAAGGPSKRLWLDPATVTNDGQDAVFRGHSPDRSDAFNPADSIKGWTPPVFEPDSMNVFTVTTNAEDAVVSLAHFPRFLHNAREVAA